MQEWCRRRQSRGRCATAARARADLPAGTTYGLTATPHGPLSPEIKRGNDPWLLGHLTISGLDAGRPPGFASRLACLRESGGLAVVNPRPEGSHRSGWALRYVGGGDLLWLADL